MLAFESSVVNNMCLQNVNIDFRQVENRSGIGTLVQEGVLALSGLYCAHFAEYNQKAMMVGRCLLSRLFVVMLL